ncbi:conserved hypothetical protein [Culex quinquefasciatus]|uniref:Ig-like domain-containing protein n=1 Tax=Culex quinquefasciatus TaxID=7176 RepID=B0WL84_CULQU|nr:conserved hypothetical protein [Culex quinquefasciatus]|eukprot:XP_001849468.1 conserved hypothetical protein [Culex quinquefasciatus]
MKAVTLSVNKRLWEDFGQFKDCGLRGGIGGRGGREIWITRRAIPEDGTGRNQFAIEEAVSVWCFTFRGRLPPYLMELIVAKVSHPGFDQRVEEQKSNTAKMLPRPPPTSKPEAAVKANPEGSKVEKIGDPQDAKQSRPRQQPELGRGNLREPNSSSGTPSKEGGAGAGRGRVLEKDKASFLPASSFKELQLFHGRNAIRGRNVDSHRLVVVVARDWWLKVNSREDWGRSSRRWRCRSVARETSTTLPESMANSSKIVLIEGGNVTIVLHCCRASKPPSGTVQPGQSTEDWLDPEQIGGYEPESESQTKLLVTNIPRQVEEADILGYLAKFGKIVDWQMQKSVISVQKNSAFECDVQDCAVPVCNRSAADRQRNVPEPNHLTDTTAIPKVFPKSSIRIEEEFLRCLVEQDGSGTVKSCESACPHG